MEIDSKEVKISKIREELNKHKSVKIGHVVISNIPNFKYRVYNTGTGKTMFYEDLDLILKDHNYFEKHKQMSIL
jgi:hypothetical protein